MKYIHDIGGTAIVKKIVRRFGKDVLNVLEVLREDGWVAEKDGVFRLTGEVTITSFGSYGDGICLTFHAPVPTEVVPSSSTDTGQ